LGSLDSLSKILISNIDSNKKNCKLDVATSKTLLNVVHARIDELSNDHFDFSRLDKTCLTDCHCEFYTGLLENMESSTTAKLMHEKIKKLKTSKSMESVCLKKAVRILCKSKLLLEIKKSQSDFAPAPGH
jgi:hypothetical protein